MDLLYTTLTCTTIAMMTILAMVFFDRQLKSVLSAQTYKRVFISLAVLATVGILFTATIGFKAHHHTGPEVAFSVVVTQ